MADEFPSRSLDKIVIRVPDGMRSRIARVAKENGRSINAEIVQTLEDKYPPPVSIAELKDLIKIRVESMELFNREEDLIDIKIILEALFAELDKSKKLNHEGAASANDKP